MDLLDLRKYVAAIVRSLNNFSVEVEIIKDSNGDGKLEISGQNAILTIRIPAQSNAVIPIPSSEGDFVLVASDGELQWVALNPCS